jgi:DeoR family transcriptional regulator, aga operon transcriptional repressor
MRVSREVTVVADSSKFRRRSLSVISKIDTVHRVVSDDKAPADVVAALRARNIEVVLV